jgi:hypothetical protein
MRRTSRSLSKALSRGLVAASVTLLIGTAGCRCRGTTKVGDRRAFTCAELPSEKDARETRDLGGGLSASREGFRVAIRGAPEAAILAFTSLEGEGELEEAANPSPVAPSASASTNAPSSVSSSAAPKASAGGASSGSEVAPTIRWVVGLGRRSSGELGRALSRLAKDVGALVVVAGPSDDWESARATIATLGPRVLDGSLARVVTVGGVEVVAFPGSDDPSSLAKDDRGCVLRVDDVKALAARLGPADPARPRVVVAWSRPSRGSGATVAALDAWPPPRMWLVAGPLDDDLPEIARWAPDASPPLLPVPRAFAPRTGSRGSFVAPGEVRLDRIEATLRTQMSAAPFGIGGAPR